MPRDTTIQMSTGYSIKSDNKPTLFSWDLETEFQNVDRRLATLRKTNDEDLNTKRAQLRQLKSDLLDIIKLGKISDSQITSIFSLVKHGRSGVWETATTEIGRLAYHFADVKSKLITELGDNDGKYVSKLITAIDTYLTTDELKRIFLELLQRKNMAIRNQALNKILDLRLAELKDELQKHMLQETNKEIFDNYKFVLKNIDQPKGRLVLE